MKIDVEVLRAAAATESWSSAITELLKDAPAEDIALAMTETAADERKLRIALQSHLARLWPRSENAYQNACMHFAAGDVRRGERAFPSNIGIHQRALNEDVIASHLEHEDGCFRIAAAQMMRATHLAHLEKQVERERDAEVKAALVSLGQRLAQERGAPPTTLLDATERHVAMARQLGRGKHWMRWTTLADCAGSSPEALKSGAAGEDDFVSSGVFVFVVEGRLKPPPVNPEYVDERETSLRLAMDLKTGPKQGATIAELWLKANEALWMPELSFWLGIDWLAEAFEGVSLRAGGDVLVVRDSKLVGECDRNALLRMQHPADAPQWQGDEPLWQRNRPVYALDDLDGLEDKGPIDYKDWSKRTKKLGYKACREKRVVQQTRRAIGNVTLRHTPYGHGYGGNVPVKFESIGGISSSLVTTSEMVWDARRVVGVDALKPKKDEFI